MIRTIRSWFAWEIVGCKGAYDYLQNKITGKRRVVKVTSVHGVIDWDWVEGKADDLHRATPRPPVPAPASSGRRRTKTIKLEDGREICLCCGRGLSLDGKAPPPPPDEPFFL